MTTTVKLDEDVRQPLQRLWSERGRRMPEVINELTRCGLAAPAIAAVNVLLELLLDGLERHR
jgi:hypothetical protein